MSFLYNKKKQFLNLMKMFLKHSINGASEFPISIHINSTKWPSHDDIPLSIKPRP